MNEWFWKAMQHGEISSEEGYLIVKWKKLSFRWVPRDPGRGQSVVELSKAGVWPDEEVLLVGWIPDEDNQYRMDVVALMT